MPGIDTRARADRDQQRVGGVAEDAARGGFDVFHAIGDARAQRVVELLAVGVVDSAKFGADRQTRRHGQADAGHLRQIGALATHNGLVARARIDRIGAIAEFEYVWSIAHAVLCKRCAPKGPQV
jgi:hypothetical protein